MVDPSAYQSPEQVYGYPAWTGAPTADALISDLRSFLEQHGVTSASYRKVSHFHSQLDGSAHLYHFGFPDSWVELYDRDLAFRQYDPIADFIVARGRFMTWVQAIAARNLSVQQQRFVASMREHGLVDGVALPLYGPRGKEAYSTYSFGRECKADDLQKILLLNDLFQHRHCDIAIAEDLSWQEDRALSKREKEVLFWMAKGKSNHDIADILSISRFTAAEYVKRLYFKLDVSNRIDAARVGLQRGIINLSSTD